MKIILVNSKKHRDEISNQYGSDNLLITDNTSSLFKFSVKGREDMEIYMNKNLFGDIEKVTA